MINTIKVSIIVPIYNVEKYIERCLISLINQTLKDIEIIIINDQTPDNSMEICKEYAKRDKRIKIIENKKNIGLGLTRNKGIKIATGDYVAFIDSDDFVDNNFYEMLYKKIKVTNTDACFARFIKCYNEKIYLKNYSYPKIDSDSPILKKEEAIIKLLESNSNNEHYINSSVCKSLYKRSIINKYNIKYSNEKEFLAEDILFNLDYLKYCKSISICKNTNYYYCYNINSLTHRYSFDTFERANKLREELIKKIRYYKEKDLLLKNINNIYVGYVRYTIKQEVYNTKEYKKNIKRILNDKVLKKALYNKTKEKLTRTFFDFLIKKEQINLIVLICKLYKKFDKWSV